MLRLREYHDADRVGLADDHGDCAYCSAGCGRRRTRTDRTGYGEAV